MQKNDPAGDGLFPPAWFGKLLLVSLLVMLNMPAIFTGATSMDQYRFFTLDQVNTRPWPLVLSVLLSTGSAIVGYGVYRVMRKRQAWYAGNRYGAFHRSALLFGVPIGIAFAPLFFLTGYNDEPTALSLSGIMATGLCMTAGLHDKETRLDPETARIWFVACIAFILVFLTLCVAAMLVLYLVEQAPSSGNLFWSWDFNWSNLGYPAEEFSQRHRNGTLAFTLAGSCYMTVAIGGSLLGAILAWSKTEPNRVYASGSQVDALQDPSAIAEILDDEQDSPEFVVALNGEETTMSHSQYESMLADKDRLLPRAKLLVDKASGTAFAKTAGRWKKLSFRGKRKGPFLLLCVYARHPGRRFTTAELEFLLKSDLPDRDGFNVSDFFAQLQKRTPLVPVQRDDHGTYIPETATVCFLDHWPAPDLDDESDAAPEQHFLADQLAR